MTRQPDRIAKLNEPAYRDIIHRVLAAHRDVPHKSFDIHNCKDCDELDEQLCIDAGLEDPPESVIDGEVLNG